MTLAEQIEIFQQEIDTYLKEKCECDMSETTGFCFRCRQIKYLDKEILKLNEIKRYLQQLEEKHV